MKKQIVLIGLLPAILLSACVSDGYGGQGRPGRANHRDAYRYDPAHESERRYEPRQIGDRDRIYRDRQGRYYCKRSDGTTGTIVGALAGGALGNIIAPGGSKTLGTLLGAGGGALAGRAIDRNNVRCE
ncbi:glycine zipper 2TM domain-containing protein [Sphingobium yanoikuyae]|uniref:glycine zipper 2TM domain-containing protein n=1 Tax=Sphingobium yanoikuyae TaxID=13690 RepID=UPI00241C7285|nr:glycine zipper 2TM domain-containing protein [Sphingobium yanoikuyae]